MKVAVFGLPASGKGTLCARLKEKMNLTHISSGDLLREYMSEMGSSCSLGKTLGNGNFAGDELIIHLIRNALPSDGYLLDGFPRRISQKGVFPVDVAVFIRIEVDTAVERMRDRAEKEEVVRSDDNTDAFRQRIKNYNELTMPVIEAFRAENRLIEVDGEREKDEVVADAMGQLESMK
ncbi:KAD [Enterospora canceri]|uniref:KAD n=1 Tax=Enterospora canceri TaxID=1081671 RepID=A0A1Y1S8U4_9MICR|nr:KAD [Enterospora canceri]